MLIAHSHERIRDRAEPADAAALSRVDGCCGARWAERRPCQRRDGALAAAAAGLQPSPQQRGGQAAGTRWNPSDTVGHAEAYHPRWSERVDINWPLLVPAQPVSWPRLLGPSDPSPLGLAVHAAGEQCRKCAYLVHVTTVVILSSWLVYI